MTIALIAAVAENNVIGVRGQLPWHLPRDFAWFKATTSGKCIIMGRKTFESLDCKPLPKRLNIIISRTPRDNAENVVWVNSLDAAFDVAKRHAVLYGDEIMVIGGGDIYTAALPRADRLYITHVACAPRDGDAFFPPFNTAHWNKKIVETHDAVENRPAFVIAQYDRK
jgi:dihydrofolate reductase